MFNVQCHSVFDKCLQRVQGCKCPVSRPVSLARATRLSILSYPVFCAVSLVPSLMPHLLPHLSRPVSDRAPSSRAPSLSLLSSISRSLALSSTPRPSHSFPVSHTLSLVPVFCMCPDRWSSVKSTGAPPTDIAGHYSALLKAGIVAATGTPVGAGATVTSEDTAAAPSMSSENLSWDVPSCYWSPQNTHCLSQDWVHEGRVDVKGKGRADGPRSTNNKAALVVDAARRDAELHMQFIVVPPGDEAKPITETCLC